MKPKAIRKQPSAFREAKSILAREKANLAILVGNGINLTRDAGEGISWDRLMEKLMESAAATSQKPGATKQKLRGLLERGVNGETPASLPEIFDIIEAVATVEPGMKGTASTDLHLQRLIANMLKTMKPAAAHRAVTGWAIRWSVPILTTNYDHCLEEALTSPHCSRRRFGTRKPLTDYYPWDRYYAPHEIGDPLNCFGVWHIHGDRDLKRSIRAGLDQYMGMVERLRGLKRKVAREILSDVRKTSEHDPAFHKAPWLRPFMGRKLWIQGLGLRAAEVSIRWLLVQRFRYWRRYMPLQPGANGWYVHGPTNDIGRLDEQRRTFFESIGLEVIEIPERQGFYVELFGELT